VDGHPGGALVETEREKLLRHGGRTCTERVVGQDDAVRACQRRGAPLAGGLGDPNRPIGSFLFLGPTGVGKTELCKALAEFLFDTEDAWCGST
jgi:ATP-dependent Clp protease ATP-binding subunit ClpB